MGEIFVKSDRRGFALITSTILTALLLVLGAFFVSISTTDIRIALTHGNVTRAYYLTEAATSLLIREIQDDNTLNTAFIDGTLSSANSTRIRQNVFEQGDQISVYAESSGRGIATIYATGTLPSQGNTIIRRTRTDIARALGGSVTDYSLLIGGNNQDLKLQTDVNINGGIIYASDDAELSNNAHITVNQGQLWAHDEIRINPGSTLTLNDSTTTEGVPALDMPGIDFDSAEPTAWRRQATQIMTPSQFNALLTGTTLTGIIFVDGSPADLKKDLTINGLLVINGSFEIEYPANLRILQSPNWPSGLLVKNTLEIEHSTYVEGLVYASNYLEIEYDTDDTQDQLNVTVQGGLIGRQAVIRREASGPTAISITHDDELIGKVLQQDFNQVSPLIDVNHWEEEY